MSTSTTEYPMFEYAPSRPSLMIMDRTIKWKPNNFELAPNCPRCASSNTKFCYYNNYSFSQPRYFCKACRRYWTKGGSLRNVPVGGGCRKTRRTRSTRHEDGADYPIHTVGSGCVETINQSESGGEIDLAAVFANENVENDAASDEVPVSSSDIDPQIGDSNPVFACAEPVDMINGSDQNTDDQDFVYRNYSGFEMEGVLGEVEADMLWSEGIEFPSFGSELQDFEMFSAYDDDDQMRISANLVNDNWDYEIFTGP